MIDYKRLLEEHQLWPMERWNHFDVMHQSPANQEEEEKQIEVIRGAVSKAHGLYAYRKGDVWIYVGKAAPLFSRLKSHYRESHRRVPGDTKDQRWHRFFAVNAGPLSVYWKEIGGETDRRIFELALTEVLAPTFERYP